MKLKDVMTTDVEVVEFDSNLQEAAVKMKSLDIGALLVREGTQLVGIVTDRDITIRAVAEGLDPKHTAVAEVMTTDFVYGYEHEDVAQAARRMGAEQIRRLPVLNEKDELVGIVSLGDLAVDTANDSLKGEVLEQISEPASPDR